MFPTENVRFIFLFSFNIAKKKYLSMINNCFLSLEKKSIYVKFISTLTYKKIGELTPK